MRNFSGLRECADFLGEMFGFIGGNTLYRYMLDCPVHYNPSPDSRLYRQLVPTEGALSHAEGLVLYALARISDAENIVELGTFAGHSTNYLAAAVREIGGRVDTVDLVRYWGGVWRGQAITLRNRFVVRQHKMDAKKYLLSKGGNSIDFVFEDTSHETYNTLGIIGEVVPRLRSGGILAIHDVGVEECGVARAIKYSGLDFFCFKVFPGEQGLAVWRKP